MAPPRGKLVHGFDGNFNATGDVVNLTPYTWTLVESGRNDSNVSSWDANSLPKTVAPGQTFTYKLGYYGHYGIGEGTHEYSGFFTYRADAINHSEYLTVNLEGTRCVGLCLPRDGPYLVPKEYNSTAAPTHNNAYQYDFSANATPNPEIGATSSGPALVWPYPVGPGTSSNFDFTFAAAGNYTLDASKLDPQAASLLSGLCAKIKGANTSCSFTQIGDIRWGIGPPVAQTGTLKSCDSKPPSVNTGREIRNPPQDDPDWHEVSVEVARTHSVSIGGSVSASIGADVFGVIDTEVTSKIGVEHEWSETTAFEKTTRVFVPRNWVAGIWVAPVIGKVTGTLVFTVKFQANGTTKTANYTINNLEETASGVSKDLTTPAFNIITNSRQMTPQEWQAACHRGADIGEPTGLG